MDTSKKTMEFDFSLDFLLQETLSLTEKINKEIIDFENTREPLSDFEEIVRNVENTESHKKPNVKEIPNSLYPDESDQDFLFNLVDEVYEKGITAIYEKENILRDRNLLDPTPNLRGTSHHLMEPNEVLSEHHSESSHQISLLDIELIIPESQILPKKHCAPQSPGVIYRIDLGANTFCVRGFSTDNIQLQLDALAHEPNKLMLLKASTPEDKIFFFETKSYEIAEMIKDQIINRRFPRQEDAVCNISDPGYSWWMDISHGKFEIFFKSHAVNREEQFIKLGPIGDAKIAMIRLNQAHALLRSTFPLNEYCCSDKSFIVSTTKPDHSSFLSFQKIFSSGENHSTLESFPDNTIGKTLYFYFLELATLRKFWIEVESKLS